MIRAGHIAAISCTGANLEEDLFNLVAHNHYQKIDDWRSLSAQDEADLLNNNMNRVTDTCIPEDKAFRKIESYLMDRWEKSSQLGQSKLPHQFFYDILLEDELEYQALPENSWLLAAAQVNLPLVVPGWEDSTLGNIFAARVMQGKIEQQTITGGIGYMTRLAEWYCQCNHPLAFLQLGGGIAGDFPICVVPLLNQDLEKDTPLWSWFCQISESTPSYGGYSGAPPNEKITWGKLSVETEKFVIESDATIVAPLMFCYILDI
jgi:deoxyhypusine synthase